MGVLSPSSPPREGSTVSARRGAGGGANQKSDRSERLPPGHHHAHHHHQKQHLSGRSAMAAAGPGPSSVSPPLSISSGLLLRHVPLLVSIALFSWSLSVYLTRVGHPWLFSSSSSSSSSLSFSLSSSRSTLADDCRPLIASSNSSSLLLQSSHEREGAFPGQDSLTIVSGGGGIATEQERVQQLPHLTGAARLAGVMHQLEAMIGEPHAPPPEAAGRDARRRGALELPAAAATVTSSATDSGALAAQQQQPHGPLLSIFCAPKPYGSSDDPSDPQRRALLSWLRLSPPARVILLGNDPSFHALAREFPGRISVEPDVDTNFYGVPLFHSMLARAQAADTPLSMIINGDIILLADLMPVVAKVRATFEHWVLTAARWDVAADFPFVFEKPPPLNPSGAGFSLGDGGGAGAATAAWDAKVRTHVRAHGSLHTYGGVDFWMWNSDSPAPLFRGAMPPFSFGRGKYDNWLTHEVVDAGLRQMVDASEAVTSVHVAHSYAHVADAAGGADGKAAAQKSFWSTRKQTSWELYANIHLAQTHGTYSNQKGTGLHVPWRIVTCNEAPAANVCMQRRLRPANCSCEYSPYVRASQSDPRIMESNRIAHWLCGTVSVDETRDFAIDPVPNRRSKPGLPHTMEQILPQVAREVDGERVVTLVAVTFGYAEMLMSFVCRLRALGLADNLVVAALDEDLYRFAFTQGLAVYYERVSTSLRGLDSKNCAFGSTCFRQFTKLKSRAVLRVLQAGYSVLWTDVDIVWYADPLPDLMAFGPGTFPIQSNEPNASLPGTGIRRINSGFYFARADKKTVAAFEAITAHAAKTKLSEQPSFYDVLCGVKGEYLAKEPGREECVWKRNGLRTVFLDRSKYPNGAVHGFWEARDVSGACRAAGCLILHNNWISGKDEKRRRMVDNGYWHYDAERRMCIWPWHLRLPPVVHAHASQ